MNDDFLNKIDSNLNSKNTENLSDSFEALYWIADIYRTGGYAKNIHESTAYLNELKDLDYDISLETAVKDKLRSYIRNGENEFLPSAISILGMFGDQHDVGLIMTHLEKALTNIELDNSLLHQSLIALRDLNKIDTVGEYWDTFENVKLASKFLERQNNKLE